LKNNQDLREENACMKQSLYNVGLLINKSYKNKGDGFQNPKQHHIDDFKINLISCIDGIYS
jgi:hypothetical protein|tara:strand:- start:152 stop:334 length:183 start_codon:yes stop_codon:yes gene_type:complete